MAGGMKMDKLVSVFVGLLKAIPLPLGGSHSGISFLAGFFEVKILGMGP